MLGASVSTQFQSKIARHQPVLTRQEVLHLLLTLTQRFVQKPPIHCHLESDATHRGDKRELRKSGKHQASLESTLVSVRRLRVNDVLFHYPASDVLLRFWTIHVRPDSFAFGNIKA